MGDYGDAHLASLESLVNHRSEIPLFRVFSALPDHFMVFSGLPGRGKTYCAQAVLNARFKDFRDSLFIRFMDMYLKWQSLTAAEREHYIYSLCEYNILVIDDMNRNPSVAFYDFIFMVIDCRYTKKVGTIITTNCNSIEMTASFGPAFVSRITTGKCYKFTGEDLRKGVKKA